MPKESKEVTHTPVVNSGPSVGRNEPCPCGSGKKYKQAMTEAQKAQFKEIGASCHSVEDALEAVRLGSTYLTAGHIFDTDCKKGLPGRGLDFLRAVCENVSVPVYGIGGINCENLVDVRKAGAKGACVMSGAMQCEDVGFYLNLFM